MVAKKRLIIHLLFALLTLFTSVVTNPQIAEANTGQPAASSAKYVVLHQDVLDLSVQQEKTAKATPSTPKLIYKGPKEVEKVVKSYFKDTPLLASIAECESHFQQYTKSGEVYRGRINTSDVGVMQINEKYHAQNAKRLGIDIYSLDGNLAYAKYLYGKDGSYPWMSSSGCWGSQTAYNNSNVSK